MLQFKNFPYERIDMSQLKYEFTEQLNNFTEMSTYEQEEAAITAILALQRQFLTAWSIASNRFCMNTEDDFYKKEQKFYDEQVPYFDEWKNQYYRAILHSPHREKHDQKWGKVYFALVEKQMSTFSPDVLYDLQEENKYCSEYVKLIASAKVEFEGKELSLPELGPYQQSTDRDIRKKAIETKYQYLKDHEAELDQIFDKLVQIRTTIAHKLGFPSFVELGYARMQRIDYDQEMVSVFREQVKKQIVPAVNRLKERQRQHIGVSTLTYYDDPLLFPSGNPVPKGDPEWILENGRRMYKELSSETNVFFQMMVDRGLLDVYSRKGKAAGGYCDYFQDQQVPFIFANFNGTSHDVVVLTHEVGHAFQAYSSRHISMPECIFPTSESAEIHSMSMEFLTWPWMPLFFKEDAEKFKYEHVHDSLSSILYICMVDEYQHYVYENHTASVEDRKQAWRQLEREYRPYYNFEENDYLDRGNYWHQQRHIFKFPFYYIDYGLAQICAFQFWQLANKDREQAWKNYLRICEVGGSKSFTEIVELAGLHSPFKAGCLDSVVQDIVDWLEQANYENM
ncbi:M3 family oligoendopeptidase [Brevibacillus laterosporus]|uniref:M3 family oligoendopeptidase n=1 Tax=Brevibacillus laterosporus TaxID=1465 RepID=UPI003D22137C